VGGGRRDWRFEEVVGVFRLRMKVETEKAGRRAVFLLVKGCEVV
jgi:hypothetical protein